MNSQIKQNILKDNISSLTNNNLLIYDNKKVYAFAEGISYSIYVLYYSHIKPHEFTYINDMLEICKYLAETFNVNRTRILIKSINTFNDNTKKYKKNIFGRIIMDSNESKKWFDDYFKHVNGFSKDLLELKKKEKYFQNDIYKMIYPYVGDNYYEMCDEKITNFLSLESMSQFFYLCNDKYSTSDDFFIFINDISIKKENNYRIDIQKIFISFIPNKQSNRKNSGSYNRKNSGSYNRKNSGSSNRKNSGSSNRKNSGSSNFSKNDGNRDYDNNWRK